MNTWRDIRDRVFEVQTTNADLQRRSQSYIFVLLCGAVINVAAFVLLAFVDFISVGMFAAYLVSLLGITASAIWVTRAGYLEFAAVSGAIATAIACSSYSLTTRTFDPSMMLLIIAIFIAGFVLEVRGAIISVVVSLAVIVAVISWNHESELWTLHQTYWSLGTIIMCILSALVSMASAQVNRRFFLAEQRSLEEQDRLRRHAESASQAKSAFLASMSHELRTPLNAIIGYAEMIEEDAGAGVLDTIADDAAEIHKAGHHLLVLVNDILDLSKVEAGRMDADLEEVDVNALVEELAASCRPLAARGHNELLVTLDPDLGPTQTDRRKLRQIALNLLSNAAKFTENGTIEVSTRQEGEAFVVAVRDTGVGIPNEARARIFDAFEQAGDGRNRAGKGTGLGLSLVREFVVLLGGEVWVESEVGVGSTFSVRLPLTLR